jgi:hypothetical protein
LAIEQLQVAVKPHEYFHEKVSKAVHTLNLKIKEDIEFYLVNLLCDFITPPPPPGAGQNLDPIHTPLAIMYKTALESPPSDQFRILKQMGDSSLYMSGYFQDYFNRKTFDIDYYIAMGQTAYSKVSALARDQYDKGIPELYQSLSDQFVNLVDVVAEVSDPGPSEKAVDILAIYDRWTKSNSERLRKILENLGINPVKSPTKTPQ